MNLLESWLLVPVLLVTVSVLFLLMVRLIQQLSPSTNATKAVMTAKGYLLLGRTRDAFDESRNAIELDSENAEAHSLLGRLLMERGEVKDSAEQIKQAVQLEPQNDSYWRDLGLILLLLAVQKRSVQLNESLFDEAMFAFRQAYRIDPLNVSNCLHIDMIETATGLTSCSSLEFQWEGWSNLVHQLFRKQISEPDCFDEIAKQPFRVHLAEAHLHVALYHLISTDFQAAKRDFRASYWHGSDYDPACKAFLSELRRP
jgi:tetratricopeptide (TPR) repeat protein